MAGVMFSQLPDATEVSSNDQIAMLDVSGNVLTKTPIAHASTSVAYGIGSTSNFGHLKISDTYSTVVGDAASGVAASQAALKAVYDQALIGPDIPLSVVNGQLCVTYQTSTT